MLDVSQSLVSGMGADAQSCAWAKNIFALFVFINAAKNFCSHELPLPSDWTENQPNKAVKVCGPLFLNMP